ncbi:hypothetical protein [Nocardiopsis trehalosi]|uniref:hypothetical protein n=1 Tax=Nocardiopsis trehalosi TaxID=109329 RepID=UPI0012F74EEA|nr:hypothetical protein [Nocardiopsis trehalosi]
MPSSIAVVPHRRRSGPPPRPVAAEGRRSVLDAVYVGLTLACFAVIALVARGAARL